MSKNVNEVHLVGNVGRDAERYGAGPVKFSIATGGGTSKKTGKTFPVDWHACQVWDSSYLPLIRKGCEVELHGRISYESWEDKKTGEKKTRAVIVAQKLEVLGSQVPNSDRHDFDNQPPADASDPYDGLGINGDEGPPF